MHPLNIPNFNKENSGFLREEHLEKLKFRVANITDYCDNEETLVEHINEEGTEIFRDKSFKLSINIIENLKLKIFSEPPLSVSQT